MGAFALGARAGRPVTNCPSQFLSGLPVGCPPTRLLSWATPGQGETRSQEGPGRGSGASSGWKGSVAQQSRGQEPEACMWIPVPPLSTVTFALLPHPPRPCLLCVKEVPMATAQVGLT